MGRTLDTGLQCVRLEHGIEIIILILYNPLPSLLPPPPPRRKKIVQFVSDLGPAYMWLAVLPVSKHNLYCLRKYHV
jgi:hypothetical protein